MKMMFLAKPNAMNFNGVQRFKTVKEAMKFLETVTEYKMPLYDWLSIGKIIKSDSVGNVSEFSEEEIEKLCS